MSKKPIGEQINTINPYSPFKQQSFDVLKFDQQSVSGGAEFCHYKAMPSPIGLKDQGDYRRSDGVDTITSNGMIFTCAGNFTATMISNDRSKKWSDGSESDPSMARLVLPRFYNKPGSDDQATGERIMMAPGDRVYHVVPDGIDDVSNYQRLTYDPNTDTVPMFPIRSMDGPIVDSLNRNYICGVDFQITKDGNIRWIAGGKNPGFDVDSNSGRVISARYLYKPYYYVLALPHEVRIVGVTTGDKRDPVRMPYHATIVREYLFHNQNRADVENTLKPKDPKRQQDAPVDNPNPNKYTVRVETSDFSEE